MTASTEFPRGVVVGQTAGSGVANTITLPSLGVQLAWVLTHIDAMAFDGAAGSASTQTVNTNILGGPTGFLVLTGVVGDSTSWSWDGEIMQVPGSSLVVAISAQVNVADALNIEAFPV